MAALRLNKVFAATITLLLVGACSQNPQFRMNVASQAYGSINELYVMLAKADLGAFRTSSSFAGAVDGYATVIGGFELGRLMGAGRPAGPEIQSLNAAIDQCIDQVRRMAASHKKAGVTPGSDVIKTVRQSCERATRVVAATEESAWLFSTLAGDL